MAVKPLVLTAKDFAPLAADAKAMGGAIDALEKAMVAEHEGKTRQGNLGDETKVGDQPSTLRFNLIGSDGMATGVRAAGSANGINSGFLMLFDGESRELLALMNTGALGAIRVGAEGGLGARHLAPQGAKTLAMIGSGRQARTQMPAVVSAMPGLERIVVFSPTQEHREAFSKEMSSWLGRSIEPVGSIDEALHDADVVDLVNTSREPIFQTDQLKPGALVIAITGRGEVPADFVTRTRMVAPVWEILAASPVRDPWVSAIKAGTYNKEHYAGDLGAIITKSVSARMEPTDIVDFEATSVPIMDHAIAEWAYNWARANNAGSEFSLE